MLNGIYIDSSQSGYVPNIFSIGIIGSVDSFGLCSLTLSNTNNSEKLDTITNASCALWCGSEVKGKTYSKLEVVTGYISDIQ